MRADSFWVVDVRSLVDCAMGRKPADVVIRGGKWVCVQTGEIIPDTDIAIKNKRIAFVGKDASHTIGPKTQIIEAHGKFMVPGLLDAHMHVESGMLTVTEFVRAVLPHGTTAMFIDPHEIANIFGLRGVRLMVEEANQQPAHIFVQMPSCVPSAPGLETPGAVIGPAEVAEAMTWPGIIGLGEVMNFPGVYNCDEKVHAEIAVTRQARKVIGGHYASPDIGLPFHGYAAGGPSDDHEGTRLEDAVARARQGMWVMMRYASAWHDVAEQMKAITELGMDPRHFILCTDDSHCETLVYEGHVDRAIRHAIEHGMPPMMAIQMATINPAEYFGVGREIGSIAPGRFADILIVDDLAHFEAKKVICGGKVVAQNGSVVVELPLMSYPEWVRNSVHLQHALVAEDFRLAAPEGHTVVTANVIGVIENQAPTHHLRIVMNVEDGQVKIDTRNDIAKVALVERHHSSGRIQVGLVQGFGFNTPCAMATTLSHDSHHMLIVGTDEDNMAMAGNALAEWGGGQVAVKNGEIIGKVELPIAGLMSNEVATVVANKAQTVLDGFRACGCQMNNPNMQLSILALVVIPDLRISDLGLVDVSRFTFIPVVE